MKQKILVFGNLLVKEDSLAIRLIPKLQKEFPEFEFIEVDSTETLENFGSHLNIIDVSPGIKEVKLLEINNEKDLEKLKTEKITSMHDFDLGYNLKLLIRVGKIKSAKVICLPMNMKEEEAINGIGRIIRKSLNTT
jgi:Ni,Fe-hydrogenase maturation factor